MSESAQLAGTSWVSWDQARQMLAGCDCVWVDRHGLHRERVPDVIDASATHLWAWDEQVMHRLRLDGGDAIVATLGGQSGESVGVRQFRGTTWAESHVRTDAVGDVEWEITEVLPGSVMTFVRPA